MKWISVKERLPEGHQDVLIWYTDEAIVGWYTGMSWYAGVRGDCVLLDADFVTHWAEIEPPKK